MKNSKDRKHVRQNEAYTASRKHEANLRRNPTLHFQIGLILALLVSIFFMEIRMPEQSHNQQARDYDAEEAVWDEHFQIETKVVKVPKPIIEEKQQPQPHIPDEVTPVDDNDDIIETLFKGDLEADKDTPIVDPNVEVPYVEPVEVFAEVDFRVVEEAPLFPGCEGLDTNDERKACMSSKISKFVNKKFNSGIAGDLGLSGINKIFVQFTVDKTGTITNVKSRGPHDKLEEEAQRVIQLLPEMKPGKQRSVPVGVIYNLPITLKIKD